MFKSLLATITLLTPLAFAGRPEDDKNIDRIIHEAYYSGMDEAMVRMVNTAKKQKLAADFFAELNNLPPKIKKDLQDIFKDTPTPSILPVSRGLEFKMGDEKFSVTYSSTLGEVKFNGDKIELPAGKTFRQLATEEKSAANSIPQRSFELFFPQAEANPLVKSAVGWAKSVVKFAVKGTVVGAAGGAMAGATLGCIYGMHRRNVSESIGQGCEDGAKPGVLLFAGIYAPVGTGLGGWWGADEGWWNMSWAEREAWKAPGMTAKKALINSVKVAGVAGALAILGHTANQVSYLWGAIINCERGGAYRVTGVHAGAQKLLYESHTGRGINLGWGKAMTTPGEIATHLKKKYPNTTDEQAAALGNAVWTEHQSMAETCKANPDKEFKVRSSDAKLIDKEPDVVR